jgi:secreted trypsin-like serine protease
VKAPYRRRTMRRTLLLLTTMALAVLLASGMAQAVINGQPDGNRHPYVGAVFTTAPFPLCSGTLISPRVFLTAGHCTAAFEQARSRTYVTFETQTDYTPEGAYAGTAHTHPDWNGLLYDVGVVVLDEPVEMARYGTLPSANLVERLDMGDPLTMVGYGARDFEVGGGQPRPTDWGTRYRATVKFRGLNGALSPDDRDTYFRFSGGSMGEGQEGSCFGDSGGPLFMPDQRTVAGVFSRVSNRRCTASGYAQRIDLPEVLAWVRSFQ